MKVAACVTTSFDIPPQIKQSDVDGFPSPLFPEGSAPSPSPTGANFEVTSGDCTVDADHCVLSPNFPRPYANNKDCTIRIKKSEGVRLNVVAFETESGYDKLKVNGQDYDGTDGPHLELATGNMEWDADGSVVKPGWKICEMPDDGTPDGDAHEATCDTVGDDVAVPVGSSTTVKCSDACTSS